MPGTLACSTTICRWSDSDIRLSATHNSALAIVAPEILAASVLAQKILSVPSASLLCLLAAHAGSSIQE